MKYGFFLPQMGAAAGPDALVRVATRAEELGYDSLWVTERLLCPTSPRTPYAGTADGSLPEAYRIVLDPIEALTYVAARTSRIGLGTSVLVMPYYHPVMLARRLTTLDVLSNGRLRVGIGQGWSEDEMEAAGASLKGRAARADEFIQVLKAIWTTDPVEFSGRFFKVAKSSIQPKPVQKPHPPIYLAAFSPGALKRAATLADGWQPVGLPLEVIKQMLEGFRGMAKQAGRDPAVLRVVMRGNLEISEKPVGGEGRFPFVGSLDEIRSDVEAMRDLGVDELIFDVTLSADGATVEGYLRRMEQLRELA